MSPSLESVESLADQLRNFKRLGVADETLAWILVQIHVVRSFLDRTNSVISPKLLFELMMAPDPCKTNFNLPPLSEPYNQLLSTFDTLVRSGKITPKKSAYWEFHSRASAITLLWEAIAPVTYPLYFKDTATLVFQQTEFVLTDLEFNSLRQLLASSRAGLSPSYATLGPEFTLVTPDTTSDEYDLTIKIQWPDS